MDASATQYNTSNTGHCSPDPADPAVRGVKSVSVDNDGTTPLHLAAAAGDDETVRLFLEKEGAESVNSVEKDGKTPLHLAAIAGHESIVGLLLEKGATKSVNSVDKDGKTPLHLAAAAGHESTVGLLLKKGATKSVNSVDKNGKTPLHLAAAAGHGSIVGLLLEKGAVDKIVELLLKKGATKSVNSVDKNSKTPLHLATAAGHESIVELLLEEGAIESVNSVDKGGKTPLHLAAAAGRESIVGLLLKKGATESVNSVDKDGKTPLHLAAAAGHKSIVGLLLEKELQSTRSVLVSGILPIAMAISILEIYQAAGSILMVILLLVVILHLMDILLLNKGATKSVNSVDKGGKTPLHLAAAAGHESIVGLLLKKGATKSVNSVDKGGKTPLHLAAAAGRESMVGLLLEKGAIMSVNSVDGNARNLMYTAFHSELETLIRKVLDEMLIRGPSGGNADEQSGRLSSLLKGLAMDMASADLRSISVVRGHRLGLCDSLKLYVEIVTGEPWDWWPFQDPPRFLREDATYVRWTGACGDRRYEEVPSNFADNLQRLLNKFKDATKAVSPYDQSLQSGSISSINQPQIGKAPTAHLLQGSIGPSSKSNTPLSAPNPGPSGSQCPGDVAINMQLIHHQLPQLCQFIFLGVNSGDYCSLAEIEVSSMDDDTFFEKLRANYNEIRGVFRRYLSYRVYNHCEFVQIERIGENTFEPGEYRPAVPDGTNNDYTFEPIPPNPMPPITKNEFKCRFYYCFRRGEPHRHYFGFRQCPKRYTPLRSALSRIPKRNFCLDKKGQNREIFWGLLAVERPSAFKVAVYHVLILIGPVMFWFLWLFFWGHSGDLQNAAIPFLTVCTLLSMFWFPMIHIS